MFPIDSSVVPVRPRCYELQFGLQEILVEFLIALLHLRKNPAGSLGTNAIDGLSNDRPPPIGNNEVGGTARPRQRLLFVLVQRLPVPLLPENTRHITGRPEYWSQELGPAILTRRMVRKTSNRYSSREVGAVEA